MARRHHPETGSQCQESSSEGGDSKPGVKGKGKAAVGDKSMNKGKKRVNIWYNNTGCEDLWTHVFFRLQNQRLNPQARKSRRRQHRVRMHHSLQPRCL